jgi:hypothetical protein
LHDFDVYIFSYDLFKLYARISLMLFIATFNELFFDHKCTLGFALMSSTSSRVDVILGNCLIDVLDLILCRSLNSKSEK